MLSEALKRLRMELGITQSELAEVLNVNFTTVNRWENSKAMPNRSVGMLLLDYAKKSSASASCYDELKDALLNSRKNKLQEDMGASYLAKESIYQLINNLPVGIGIYLVYNDGRFEQSYVNDGYYNLLGTTRENRFQYSGTSVINVIHPDDRQVLLKEVSNAVIENRSANSEFRAICDDGHYKWLNASANIVERTDDCTTLYCVFSDIDKLKSAEIQIEESQQNQKKNQLMIDNLIRNLPGAIAAFDVDEVGIHMTYISNGCVKITGFTSEETLARCKENAILDIHPNDRMSLHNIATIAVKNKTSLSHIFRVMTKSGSYHWVSLNLSPVITDNKLSYYGVYLDINSQRESEMMINQLVNALPGGVAIYKIGKKIETKYFSQGLPALTGYTGSEYKMLVDDDLIGNVVYEDDQSSMIDAVAAAVVAGKPISKTYRVKHKDGHPIWMQLNATKIREEDGCQIYYAIFTTPNEEAQLYQKIVEDSTTAVVIFENQSKKIIYTNKFWKRIKNIDEDKNITGKRVSEVVTKEDIMLTEKELQSFENDRYTEFYRLNSKGKYLHIIGKVVDWNEIKSYICYVSDETELWASHQQLQNLIDRVPSGIAIYEINDGNVLLKYVNDAYPKMLGDTKENRKKYMGTNNFAAVYEKDLESVKKAAATLTKGADLIDIQFRVPNFDGEYVWVRMVGSVVERLGNKITVYSSYSNCDDIMKTQQALQSNRIMLSAAMKSAKVNAWKLDIKNRRLILMKDYGVYPQIIENVPDSLITLCNLDEKAAKEYRAFYDKALAGQTVQADLPIPKSTVSDEKFWNRMIYTPVYDGEGQLIESIGTSIDITEQKEREQSYEEQLRLKKLIANNALAIAFYNLTQNKVAEVQTDSEAMKKMLLADSVDTAIKNIIDTVESKADKEKFAKISNHRLMLKAYAKGETHFSIRHRRKDDKRWLESNLDIIVNPYTGDVEGIATLHDITNSVRAEFVVNTLMQINYESIVTIDSKSGAPVPFTHSQMEEVMSEQKIAGNNILGVEKYIRKYCVEEDVERAVKETSLPFVRKKLENLSVYSTTYRLNQNGKTIHKQAMYTYLDDSKDTILCAVQDLTDTYEIEEKQKSELAKALKLAENASRAKTDFFSRMSHDMRTPMNGILGLAELSKNENQIEILQRNMKKIEESGSYLLSLINDTLDFQRIETGKMKLEPQVVKTDEFVQSIIDLISPVAKDKNIDFRVINRNAQLDWYVKLDTVRVKQVFVNLLSNAIKFTPRGGTVTFEFELLKRDGMVSHDLIKISDTGIGMSDEYIKNGIFKPFSQEYNQVSTQYAGSGLGLSIVYNLVKLMGGRIEVKSEQGVGTTFWVYLDFERIDEKDALSVSKKYEKKSNEVMAELNGKQILLIEDHPLNAEIAIKLLKRAGCSVDWQNNGKKGVECFAKSKANYYDVVLMDIRMPVMNGLEAAKAIRATDRTDAKSIPIIAMTANAYEEDIKQSIEAGMNAHLAKPINPQSLYQIIAENLN